MVAHGATGGKEGGGGGEGLLPPGMSCGGLKGLVRHVERVVDEIIENHMKSVLELYSTLRLTT